VIQFPHLHSIFPVQQGSGQRQACESDKTTVFNDCPRMGFNSMTISGDRQPAGLASRSAPAPDPVSAGKRTEVSLSEGATFAIHTLLKSRAADFLHRCRTKDNPAGRHENSLFATPPGEAVLLALREALQHRMSQSVDRLPWFESNHCRQNQLISARFTRTL
jgi:hypothetical protein